MIITDIKPYPNNAKRHPQKQIDLIAGSLRNYGWQQPLKLGKDGYIIVGHGRMLAYNQYKDEYKLKEPWVVDENGTTIMGCAETRKLTELEERAYRLTDNKIAESEWDLELTIPELKELNAAGLDIEKIGFDKDLIISPTGLDTDFTLPDGDKNGLEQITFTLSKEQAVLVKQLINEIKGTDEFATMPKDCNENSNGNALYLILLKWAELKT